MSREAKTRTLVEASQTLGAAFLAGLQPRARCQRGSRLGPVKVEPCRYEYTMDLETLIWAKGAHYPCWRLTQRRLKCPRCGGMDVEVAWMPGPSSAARAARDLVQCLDAATGVPPRSAFGTKLKKAPPAFGAGGASYREETPRKGSGGQLGGQPSLARSEDHASGAGVYALAKCRRILVRVHQSAGRASGADRASG